MNANQALKLLGRYNKWQIQSYLVFSFGFSIPFAWTTMSVVFTGDTPNYRCALPPNATVNDTIPVVRWEEDGKPVYDKCNMYVNISVDNSTVPCQYGYWYDPESGYQSTLTTEWDLVCGEEWLVELSMTISAVGSVIAAVVFNKLADLYGRKPVFLGCMWSNCVTALAMAFSPNMTCFIILSFFDGAQQQGMIATAFILSVELFPTEQRTFAGNAIEFFWVLGYMSLAGIAYFIRNWRYLLLALSLPLLGSISFYWLISESIPWLVTNGQIKKADGIMRAAAKRCKVSLPERLFDDQLDGTEMVHKSNDMDDKIERNSTNLDNLELSANVTKKQFSRSSLNTADDTLDNNDHELIAQTEEYTKDGMHEKEYFTDVTKGDSKTELQSNEDSLINSHQDIKDLKYGLLQLMKSAYIRRYTLIFVWTWFVNSLAYGAISLTVTYLPGDRYLNTFLYAVLEIPAYSICWILSEKVGRRSPLILFNLVGGVALCGTLIQAFDFTTNITWIVITFSMIGKTAITASYALIYVIVPELFPTNARNIGLGLCQVFARSARLLSPFSRTLHRTIPWLPSLLFGIMSIIVAFLSIMIPETRHRKLPDTIEEIEQWKKKTKI